jgi:TATA-box binding protein (TBP) (component of TFIID and TFIIIB)
VSVIEAAEPALFDTVSETIRTNHYESDLREAGLDISNIVVTITIGQNIDLPFLSETMENTEYHPEQSPYLIYRPQNLGSVTLLVPTKVNITLVEAKSKSETISGIQFL